MATLSQRLRFMLADFHNMGVNDQTVCLESIREAAAMAKAVEDAPIGRVIAGRANSFPGFHLEVDCPAGFVIGGYFAMLSVTPSPEG